MSTAMEAAARAACIADGGAPDADWVGYKDKCEWQAYVESSQAAITAWLSELDAERVERVAIATFGKSGGDDCEVWPDWLPGIEREEYRTEARAARKVMGDDS